MAGEWQVAGVARTVEAAGSPLSDSVPLRDEREEHHLPPLTPSNNT